MKSLGYRAKFRPECDLKQGDQKVTSDFWLLSTSAAPFQQRHLCIFFAEWDLISSYTFSGWLTNTKNPAIIIIKVCLACDSGC